VIGLLGGVAAGKTTVAEMLARLGAAVVSADRLGHAALARPGVRRRIVARWGKGVLDNSGRVDRRLLAARVFGCPGELAALEAITHPAILAGLGRAVGAARRAGAPAIVLDAPLLMETGLEAVCDVLVFVDCPRAARLARAAAERGWDRAELARREGCQRPLKAKRARAHYIIRNNGRVEATFQQVKELWQEILAR